MSGQLTPDERMRPRQSCVWVGDVRHRARSIREIELRFPDGPQLHQNGGITSMGTGRHAAATSKHFHYPDPLIEEILNEDYMQEMDSVASTVNRVQPSTLNTLMRKCLCRPVPQLETDALNKERTLLVALSTVPYCNASTSQWSLLRTFYSKLAAVIGDSHSQLSECPRMGAHWQNVGFQGKRSWYCVYV
uniref:MyTH4 domain-containing protein n=1 Tax=Angiostrongylus cantonensis TaxID=6313 RepID=A0A0K0DNC2_ANGCA